jgi:predicted TIM-barrel fold metal-dependent hydrolase
MTATVMQGGNADRGREKTALIDCDLHNFPASTAVLKRYLPTRYHLDLDKGLHIGGHGGQVVGARPQSHVFRRDSVPPTGRPGSSLALTQEQLLDRFNVAKAITIPLDVLRFPQYGEVGGALARALNDWNQAEWIANDDRLYGAIAIPVEDGERAAQEIDRRSDERRFVGVFVTMITREGLGHPKYWPIYEAAADRGLPIVAHVGGFSGTHLATGWPAYFVEQHTGYTQPYHAQVVSLIASGVFDRFPDLQICLQEGGIAWAPPVLWRLDRAWASMREEEPQLIERPSEVFRRHFAFTTQPMDETERPEFLPQMLEQLGMNERIMFSSDYPHWDFDDPRRVLPASVVDAEFRRAVMFENAERYWPW